MSTLVERHKNPDKANKCLLKVSKLQLDQHVRLNITGQIQHRKIQELPP